jgi:hypothetical protein
VPTLNAQLLAAIGRMPIPRLPERAMKLLLEVANVAENPEGWYLPDGQPRYLAASYSTDYRELKILLRILEDKGLLEFGPSRAIRLTASGFIAAEASKYLASPSANGFVAMSFANEMTDAYVNGFDPGVRAAGYQPVRIDQKEHANPISDEIMAEIRRARFVVADYTMSNNGVYFEAGFATGLGILVIPTCRRSEISGLHFDIRHINTLTWETPVELASALPKRISAIIGDGPLRRPTAEK